MSKKQNDLDGSITIWLGEAKDGDSLAAQALFARFFERLVTVSRNRIRRTERIEDGEDAAIESMYDFLTGLADDKYPTVVDRESVWPLLLAIVINKSKKQVRRQKSLKRGAGKTRGDSVFGINNEFGICLADLAVTNTDDSFSPSLEEFVRDFRASLVEFLEQEILDLKIQQLSNREVARILERPPSTINRKVKKIVLLLSNFAFGEN